MKLIFFNIHKATDLAGIKKKVTPNGLDNADAIMERGVLLPLHHGMTKEMFNRLHESIDEFVYRFL